MARRATPTCASSARISASLPALPVATIQRSAPPGSDTKGGGSAAHGGEREGLEARQLADPVPGKRGHGEELLGREGPLLRRPLHLDEAPTARGDDVHVDLGARVLLVGEVEHHLAAHDADGDGRHRIAKGIALEVAAAPAAAGRPAPARRRPPVIGAGGCRRRPAARRSRPRACARPGPRGRSPHAGCARSGAGSPGCGPTSARAPPRVRPRRSVAPGSIEYSAVIQPRSPPCRKRGTVVSSQTVHSTLVRPISASTEASGFSVKSGSSRTGRSSSAAPVGRRGFARSCVTRLPVSSGCAAGRRGRRRDAAARVEAVAELEHGVGEATRFDLTLRAARGLSLLATLVMKPISTSEAGICTPFSTTKGACLTPREGAGRCRPAAPAPGGRTRSTPEVLVAIRSPRIATSGSSAAAGNAADAPKAWFSRAATRRAASSLASRERKKVSMPRLPASFARVGVDRDEEIAAGIVGDVRALLAATRLGRVARHHHAQTVRLEPRGQPARHVEHDLLLEQTARPLRRLRPRRRDRRRSPRCRSARTGPALGPRREASRDATRAARHHAQPSPRAAMPTQCTHVLSPRTSRHVPRTFGASRAPADTVGAMRGPARLRTRARTGDRAAGAARSRAARTRRRAGEAAGRPASPTRPPLCARRSSAPSGSRAPARARARSPRRRDRRLRRHATGAERRAPAAHPGRAAPRPGCPRRP